MYRVRSVIKVTHDGWPGTIRNVERMNEMAAKRGWQQATVWTGVSSIKDFDTRLC